MINLSDLEVESFLKRASGVSTSVSRFAMVASVDITGGEFSVISLETFTEIEVLCDHLLNNHDFEECSVVEAKGYLKGKEESLRRELELLKDTLIGRQESLNRLPSISAGGARSRLGLVQEIERLRKELDEKKEAYEAYLQRRENFVLRYMLDRK